jgi:hypothetical protein
VTCDSGTIVSAAVLTAAPVEAEPRPLTAIALVRWLRTAWLGSWLVAPLPISVVFLPVPVAVVLVEALAMPPVAWAPPIEPPDVLT